MASARPDPAPPPSPEELDALPPFPSGRVLRLELGGLVMELVGLPPQLATDMAQRLSPFASLGPGAAEPCLRVSVRDAGRPHFLAPASAEHGRTYRLSVRHQEGALRLAGHGFAGWFRADTGDGTVALCHGSFDPPERALENFLRVGVAWSAVERGGFLLHSASIIRDGLAYLFFGASGAGKSTLSAMSRAGTVVSDDLTVVLPGSDGSFHVAGSPFRGTYNAGEAVTGLHPVHSAYRLRQDERTFVDRPSPSISLAELMSNLTFVVDQLDRVPGLAERLEERLRRLPTFRLHFRLGADFWQAIEDYHGEHR